LQDLVDIRDFDVGVYSLTKSRLCRSNTLESVRLLLGGSRKTELRERYFEEQISKGEDVVLEISWKRDLLAVRGFHYSLELCVSRSTHLALLEFLGVRIVRPGGLECLFRVFWHNTEPKCGNEKNPDADKCGPRS